MLILAPSHLLENLTDASPEMTLFSDSSSISYWLLFSSDFKKENISNCLSPDLGVLKLRF